jgi:hypothetical protein
LVVFVTGFPGELARRTITLLSSNKGVSIKLLCPSEHQATAGEFVAQLPGGADILEGGSELIDFGLSGKDYLALASEVTAILQLELPGPPGRNPRDRGGSFAAREVVELGLVAHQLRTAVVLSHLDVAGTLEGSFAEQDLELGQKFQQTAQEDRCRAERIYKRFSVTLPITVVRAGWIVGEGEGLCPIIPLLLGCDNGNWADEEVKSPLLFVDVDDLAKSLAGLLEVDDRTETLHLVTRGLPNLDELADIVRRTAANIVSDDIDVVARVRRQLRRERRENLWSVAKFFESNPNKASISTAFSESYMADHGLEIPLFDEKMVRHMTVSVVESIIESKSMVSKREGNPG